MVQARTALGAVPPVPNGTSMEIHVRPVYLLQYMYSRILHALSVCILVGKEEQEHDLLLYFLSYLQQLLDIDIIAVA